MFEIFENGFNWMADQFAASLASMTEKFPWGLLLITGAAALFLLYLGYTVAHFIARGSYKRQLARDIDAFDESRLSRKAIGLDIGSVAVIAAAALLSTVYPSHQSLSHFALFVAVLIGAGLLFRLVHELCYQSCRMSVRRAYWALSSEDEEEEPENGENQGAVLAEPCRPQSVSYAPGGIADDVCVSRPSAEPAVKAPQESEIFAEIRRMNAEESPQPSMTEQEVLENLKEFDEDYEEETEDDTDALGAILAETLQDAEFDYEDMDQNLAESAEEPVEEEPETEETPEAAEQEEEEEETPEEPEEPVEEEPETEEMPEAVEPVREAAGEPLEEETAEAEAESETLFAEQPEAEPVNAGALEGEPENESDRPAAKPQLGDEEILREIERLKNSKQVSGSAEAKRIPADEPDAWITPAETEEKTAHKETPTGEELIDQAKIAQQSADNSEESMKTMQQIALLLQKEREKKKRKTPEEQRRMNEALADLLRAIGKRDE